MAGGSSVSAAVGGCGVLLPALGVEPPFPPFAWPLPPFVPLPPLAASAEPESGSAGPAVSPRISAASAAFRLPRGNREEDAYPQPVLLPQLEQV